MEPEHTDLAKKLAAAFTPENSHEEFRTYSDQWLRVAALVAQMIEEAKRG